MRKWMLRGGVMLLGVMLLVGLLWAFSGSGHDPNHGIDMEKAREAADRVHPQPDPAVRAKMKPGHGG
jgi:hypothetical protein